MNEDLKIEDSEQPPWNKGKKMPPETSKKVWATRRKNNKSK